MNQDYKHEYEFLVGDMSIPDQYKTFTRHNVLWFMQNGETWNRDHLNIRQALEVCRCSLTFM